jgi:hypothetical protein
VDAKENINKHTLRGLAEKLLQKGKKHFLLENNLPE